MNPGTRVRVTRGRHARREGVFVAIAPTGRYILRLDGMFAPVFASLKSVKAVAA